MVGGDEGFRTCKRCGETKPLKEFAERRRNCRECTKCPICGKEPPGARSTCSDECLHELRKRHSSTATRERDDGTVEKRCHVCAEWKVRADEFYPSSRDEVTGEVAEWGSKCKVCQIAHTTEINRRIRADPDAGPELRRRQREANRRWRKRDPEHANEIVRAYRLRVAADARKRALARESARMTRRLRLEREGKDLRAPYKVQGYVMRYRKGPVYDAHPELRVPHPDGGDCIEIERRPSERKRMKPTALKATPPDQFARLPAGPLARALMRAKDIGNLSLDAFCESLGIPSRTLLRWRNEPRAVVQFNLADRLLQQLGLHWWEVWSPAENLEVAERLAA